MNEKHVFVQWCVNTSNRKNITHTYKSRQFCFKNGMNPFFSVENDLSAAKGFMEAVINGKSEEAGTYLSRSFLAYFKIDEIMKVFKDLKSYKCLYMPYKGTGRSGISPMLVKDTEDRVSVVKLYLRNEPDIFSNFKIYKITVEESIVSKGVYIKWKQVLI